MRKYFYVLVTMLLLVCFSLCGACGKSIEKQISEQLELGQRYLMEENYEEAVVAFQKVIELDEKEIRAYTGLIQVCQKTENVENIESIIQQGIALQSEKNGISLEDMQEFLIAAKEYYAQNGNLEKLAELLEILTEIEPENVEYYAELLDAYEKLGNSEQLALIKEKLIALVDSNVSLLFTADFCRPEELTVNGIPFWEADFEDVMAQYPCDDPQDMKVFDAGLESVYYVYHNMNENQANATTIFRKNNSSGRCEMYFGTYVQGQKSKNGALTDVSLRTGIVDQPNLREIEIGNSKEDTLTKLGFSNIANVYLKMNSSCEVIVFENSEEFGWYSYIPDNNIWDSIVPESNAVSIRWQYEDKYICADFIFDNSYILQEIHYDAVDA